MHQVRLRLSNPAPLVPLNEFDRSPSYFIHAGLTFINLTQPYLHEWGEHWYFARACVCPLLISPSPIFVSGASTGKMRASAVLCCAPSCFRKAWECLTPDPQCPCTLHTGTTRRRGS